MATVIPGTRGGQVEKFLPGDRLTCTASAAVTGGRLVELTGNRTVGPAAAASEKVVGISLYDAAINEKVTIVSEGVWLIRCEATVVAGDYVQAAGAAANAGSVTPVAASGAAYVQAEANRWRTVVGRALEGATAPADAPIKMSVVL